MTPWRDYIRIRPASLGPNALPVPDMGDGTLPDSASLFLRGDFHAAPGDHTADLFLKLSVPFASGKVALEVFYTPVEYYQTSIEVRDERASREYDPRGWSSGDVYFRTLVRLLEERGRRPALSLGLACKTASGDNLEGARFTNSPGYYFDLTAGRNLTPGWRLFGSLGLYVWQSNDIQHPQDDALLAALGTRYSLRNMEWSLQAAGYAGYQADGDRPLVIRFHWRFRGEKASLFLGYQAGIHDFNYQTLMLGIDFILPGITK